MGLSNNNPLIKEQYSKKLVPYLLCALLPLLLLHLYYNPSYFSPTPQFPFTNHSTSSSSSSKGDGQNLNRKPEIPTKINTVVTSSSSSSCDYTQGEWVPTKLRPLYNGTTCDTIKQGQNCMLYGRPDKDYLNWRWSPNQCKLPRFDPKTFLKLLENKHIAFVGDSLARNQLESLLCMTATVSKPELFYTDGEDNKFRKWHVSSHNINVSIYWSPFLVKGVEKNADNNFNTLYLDSVDERWASDLDGTDVLVLSVGHWYLHPAVYYYGNSLLGCHYKENCTETGFYDVFGKALNTAFGSVLKRGLGFNGSGMSVFLTTFSPAHFEGDWDKLGACPRTRPVKESEQSLDGMNAEMRRVGVEEVREAKIRAKGLGNRVRIEALDITKLALLRPDGHPGPYMNPFPFANGIGERVQNDCVHWCLPGPIDTWNEILLDVIKRWGQVK